MAFSLFVGREDIVRNSIIDGNVDFDKFKYFIKEAQETHIQNFLGTKLYERLYNDIANDTLTGDYLTLLTDYVKPMVIQYTLVDYLPFAAYQIKNGGIFKHTSENSETASKEEVDYLVQQQRNKAEFYTRRFIDFMTYNQETYPEYNTNTNDDMYPSQDGVYNNWVL